MGKFIIRQLRQDDASIYREIRLEMLQNSPDAYGESYEENKKYALEFFEKRIQNSYIAGVFEGDNIVGTAGYFIPDENKARHKSRLWGVYVKSECRGQNIGLALVKKVIDLLPKDVDLIQLSVTENNFPAINIYKKVGFRQWGIEEKALKIGSQFYNEIHMVKFLNE